MTTPDTLRRPDESTAGQRDRSTTGGDHQPTLLAFSGRSARQAFAAAGTR
ncbi:MAG: hypothetical protein M0Z63_12660 [Actinomycetota bacterium]|nr:hypothetical protein [Actinomycetota bacterium]